MLQIAFTSPILYYMFAVFKFALASGPLGSFEGPRQADGQHKNAMRKRIGKSDAKRTSTL